MTDPPAHACSPRLDGGRKLFCPPFDDVLPPKPLIPKEQVKGEIDVTSPYHLQSFTDDVYKKCKKNKNRRKCNPTF